MKLAVSALPEPFRGVLVSGKGPSFNGEVAQAYRDRPPSAEDPRRQPWRFLAESTSSKPLDLLIAVLLTPLAAGAAALTLGGAHDLLFDATTHERLGGHVEKGSWGMLGFTAVIAVVVLVLSSSLVVFTYSLYEKLWHTRRNERAREAGRHHYGIYLSHDHLLYRSTNDARSAWLVPREEVQEIVRRHHQGKGTHPTTFWWTELRVKQGDEVVALQLLDQHFERAKEVETELRRWLERGLAPSEQAERTG